VRECGVILQALAFYILAAGTVGAGFLVISARNPVHSVLFLITSFFSAAGLFVLLGAEFLAMLLVVVYVGAVAVLFLFVVMMLDVEFASFREGFAKYLPLGGLLAGLLLVELVLVGSAVATSGAASGRPAPAPLPNVSNAETIGRVLYTDYVYLFQAAGLILLVAMIGAIVLTLRHRGGVKKQNIEAQVARLRSEAVAVISVPTGAGLEQLEADPPKPRLGAGSKVAAE
jgi:NADH-quinone oxidoreductase subunit J